MSINPRGFDRANATLAAIVASSDDAIVVTDRAGTIVSWNGGAERIFGYAENQAVGRPIDFISPSDRVEQPTALTHSDGERIRHCDTMLVRKDGRRIDVSLTMSPIASPDGTIAGTVRIVRDVTDRRRLEHDARRLAAIIDSSDDAIVSKDLNGTIISWNRSAERMFGWSAAETVGRSIRMIIPPDRQAEEDEVLDRIRSGQKVDHVETIRMRKDGTLFPILLTVYPIRAPSGEIVGASKIARDLSGARRLERDARRLAAIVDSSDDAIISKDLDGIVMSWNRAAERMFGYEEAEIIGQSIRRIIPDHLQGEEDEVLARVRRGERVDHYQTIRQRKDGSTIPISLTVSPVRNSSGVVIGASKIARDITDQKRAEAERQRLLGIARDASRLKDEFLATLSHELRTPLNAVIGYTRMMQSGLMSGERQRRGVDIVNRNATSLAQIVEDVLDVSRIVSGKMRLNVQPVDMLAVTREALNTVRPAADAKGLRLETILDQNVPAVSGDPERLQQVLWNLLSNAVKFTGRGGRVQVRLERVNSHVEVAVSDTGIGIAPEFLPHVFERFRQADSGMDRAHGGLGLGLAITRHLAELQGGRIFVASEGLGKGSTFRVELPVRILHADATEDAREHPETSRPTGSIEVPNLKGIRVLAVDDDPDALALVREILEATGATVSTADSGPQALEKLQRNVPDVLLADVGMPHMNGFQFIESVRRADDQAVRQIPAAALTAYDRSEDRAKSLRYGFQIHLAKPIDPSELMAVIAALAHRPGYL